jgi:hypothetical protein
MYDLYPDDQHHHANLAKPPLSKRGYENILVKTDHFTRYAQAILSRNQTAQTTARCLWESFIQHYSFPARIHDSIQTSSAEFLTFVFLSIQFGQVDTLFSTFVLTPGQ